MRVVSVEDIDKRIPDDLVVLTDAYSQVISSSNKAWVFGATLTVVAISTFSSDSGKAIFGVNFSDYLFFGSISLILAAVNFHSCMLFLNVYEMQLVFKKYLDDCDARNFYVSSSLTLHDVAHRLVKSSLSRLYPLLLAIPEANRERVMNFVKPMLDAIYLSISFFGMWISLIKGYYYHHMFGFDVTGAIVLMIASVMVFASTIVFQLAAQHAFLARRRLGSPKKDDQATS
jgi:hypothetical protein